MIAAFSGISLIGLVLYDIYQTLVVPRFKPTNFRLAPFIVRRLLWPGYRKFAVSRSCSLKDVMLGSFATIGFVTLFIVWMGLLVAGYGLIFLSIGQDVTPPINDYWTALYVAGSSVLTLGPGDSVALNGIARVTAIAAATTGVIFMAIAVSFIFTMQANVQKRETMVNTLESRLSTSKTGLGLLLRYKELDLSHTLGRSFNQWELWAAELLETHRAFPLLTYFRSAKSCVSWVTILGALLDASALTIAALVGEATGEARLFFELATKTAQSLTSYLNLEVQEEEDITFEEYSRALALLTTAGYTVRASHGSFAHFNTLRKQYRSHVSALASHLVSLTPSLLGSLETEPAQTATVPLPAIASPAAISAAHGSQVVPVTRARRRQRHLSLVR